ncbi:hypothetical protein SLEP1_g16925 [Rubroshorea leprosula]|uniref:Uncharacterized protein n=1 Tax=Rubroshorea leprosula TaxID=152421 RepID=A0AAV5J021_9ROSI|nr:hypothetical protein SLEP1_g16925 [Rubroshorea leprosula]
MDTEEDFESFPPTDEASSPVTGTKLKRLKKGRMVEANPLPSEALDFEESNGQGFQEPKSGYRSTFEGFDEEDELSSGFDELGVEENESESDAKMTLDFESLNEEGDRNSGDQSRETEIGNSKEVESETKQVGADESDQQKEKKRKKRVNDDDEMQESTIPKKKLTQKERRKQLTSLRAESQRLLRETRDAAFKPAPLVQKPISSLLQKIRQRKLEISRKTSSVNDDGLSKEVMVELEYDDVVIEGGTNDRVEELVREEGIASQDILEASFADRPESIANQSSHVDIAPDMAVDEKPKPKQAFHPPVDDAQDLFSESQTSDSKDEIPDESPNSPVEVLAPSLLAMNLKFDSSPPDDISSDEEGNDKDNVDPHPLGSVDPSSSPNGDPVKEFVDDEAEEEDDSDNDRLCFGDNDEEEDEDSDDSEELRDLIATEYEEKPSDIERRMERHQEFLNQQDAAETEKMLQRWGLKQREMSIEEEVNEESEADMESDDEASDDLPATNCIRMSIKKLREMIPQMFTDKDDVYISSDDEEMQKSLVKQRLSEKADKQAKLLPPTEDVRSKEFFSHIKQVNNMPQHRKKAKTSSAFSSTLLAGGKGPALAKTSFIGRGSKCSLPPIQKHGSGMARSFIFEREVSNSRSRISAAEDSSITIQKETRRPAKPASAKFSNSQVTSTAQSKKTTAEEETTSKTPLLEILRRSSLQRQSSHCIKNSTIDRPKSIFAAFKLEKKTTQTKSTVPIRTL